MAKIEYLTMGNRLWLVDRKEIDTVNVKSKNILVKIYGISSKSSSGK